MRNLRPLRRARLLTLVVVGSTLLVACLPVAPPPPPPPPVPAYQTQYCSGGTPVSAGTYQAQHDGLRTVNTDFGAGDGGAPVTLPDGRTLWLFADTWTGYIRNGAMVPPYHMVRNAFVVQSGGCLTPVMGGSHGARTDLIPAPAGQWYWPMGAFAAGSTLYVFVQHYVPGGGLCGCVALDNQIAKFALPSLQFLGISASPAPGLLPEFGSGVFTANGFHHFVGRSDPSGAHRDYQYLARVPVGSNPSTTPWQYWNGGTSPTDTTNWGPQGTGVPCAPPVAPGAAGTGGACPMQFEMAAGASPGSSGPNAPLWVSPRPDGAFVSSAKPHDVYSSVINTWRSPTAYGPWTAPTWAQNTPPPPGGFTYSGRVFQLPGASPTAQYNTNGPDNDLHTDSYKIIFLGPNFPYT